LPERQNNESDTPNEDKDHVDAQAAEVLKSLKNSLRQADSREDSVHVPGGLRDDAPALTLFHNEVITRHERQPVVSRAQYNKAKSLITALNHLLPTPHDLDIILASSTNWWSIWKKMFPQMTDSRCETLKESVSHSLRSEKPAEIAKIMLCIAISVHQLPKEFDWSRLNMTEGPTEMVERYISTVGKLITSDDEICASIDGIECMMLESRYHVNMGRPRRAWLMYHRALAFAQLLGLHRVAARPDKSSSEYKRQFALWCHLVNGDRYLSLLLGLPYSVATQFVQPYLSSATRALPDMVNDEEAYLCKLVDVVTKMIDRNQSVVPMGYSATLELDQDLERVHATQSPEWWALDKLHSEGLEGYFTRLQSQWYHYQIRVLLHMPFMLRSAADKRYQYSHSAALEGARDMIRVYDALRRNQNAGPFICKLIDFQSFTAAMLLLLNLCGYAQQRRGTQVPQPDLEQDQQDSDMIDHVISLLKEAANEPGGMVAAQSAQALEMLAKVRQGCSDKNDDACGGSSTRQVSIPYFGTISIGLGRQFMPIKPGTYVPKKPGAPISLPTQPGMLQPSGLPTPPSITSSHSTQQSPNTMTIDQGPHAHRLPGYESTQYIAPGLDSWPETDDPFITFDSFMAFPPQGPLDLPPTANNVGGQPSFTPTQPQHSHNHSHNQSQSQSPFELTTNDWNACMGSGGMVAVGTQQDFPLFSNASLPIGPGQQGSNDGGGGGGGNGNGIPNPHVHADLDQGWNWWGVDAPVAP
jgi:hypothetical protein